MLIKNSTFLTSAVVASVILWRLYAGMYHSHPAQTKARLEQQHLQIDRAAAVKWRYDEMAHKLIMENTELQCAQLEQGFTEGLGKALSKVSKQIDSRAVIVNM